MPKSRLEAFTDAVLAIIMTILVLELRQPETPTLAAIAGLGAAYFSYTLSFLWLGTMWINMHNDWHAVERINVRIIWWVMAVLLTSSFFPYALTFQRDYFDSPVAQGTYGVVVLAITGANVGLSRALRRAGRGASSDHVLLSSKTWLVLDVGVKVVGFVLAITVYPPAMTLAVLVTLVVLVIPNQIRHASRTGIL